MTYTSCMAAAETLIAAALPTFTNVGFRQNQPTPYTPAMYPMALIDHGEAVENRFAASGPLTAQSGASRLSTWPLIVYLWAFEVGPAWDETAFLAYVDTVAGAFRQNPRLAGTADTSGTFVLTAGEYTDAGPGLKTRTLAMPDGGNNLTRYAEITVTVREGIRG